MIEPPEKPMARSANRTRRGPVVDPTPEEIAERSAEIRDEWPPEEREKRLSAGPNSRKSSSSWDVPTCKNHGDCQEE